LLEGSKTVHSVFKLPLNLTRVETPMGNISKQSNIAQVLKDCKLFLNTLNPSGLLSQNLSLKLKHL